MTPTNYSTAVILFNKAIRVVGVSYIPSDAKTDDHEYFKKTASEKYKSYAFKTLDPTLSVGDFVVIPTGTRHGMTCGRVEAVDIDVDFESDVQLKWIVDKVDQEAYLKVLEEEAAFIEIMKKGQARKKQEELRANVLAMHQAEGIDLSSIGITQLPPMAFGATPVAIEATPGKPSPQG